MCNLRNGVHADGMWLSTCSASAPAVQHGRSALSGPAASPMVVPQTSSRGASEAATNPPAHRAASAGLVPGITGCVQRTNQSSAAEQPVGSENGQRTEYEVS
jgi:hypothetical protein